MVSPGKTVEKGGVPETVVNGVAALMASVYVRMASLA